jgi:hypothetical protein
MADPNIEAEELGRLLEQVNEDMRRFGRITQETADALAAGSTKRARELQRAGQLSADALGNLAGAATATGRAMLEGQKGAAAFNSSLDNLTAAATAAGAALTYLIPFGPVAKALVVAGTAAVGALTAYTKAANEMADKLYKGYSGLAKAGASAADGMTGLFEDAKKLGLSMNELGDFVNIVGANSKDMALFAGTVFDGRRRLADMGKALEANRQEFIAMGLSMTDVTDGMASYLRLQTRIGQSQNKTTEQLAEGARKYLIEQDLLTKLTGLTRQEQEQAREAALSEQRFAARLEILRQQGRTEEAEALMVMNLMLTAQSKEAAQGFRDISTNNVQTEASQKLLLSTQGDAMRAAQQVAAGQMSAAEGTERVVRSVGETAKRLPSMGLIGTFDETYINFGDSIKMAGQANRDFVAEEAKAREQLAKQREGADPMLKQQSELVKTQIEANEATERFVMAGILPAQQAMINLAKVTRDSTAAIAKAFGIEAPGQQIETDVQDKANWAAATLTEKITSGVSRGVESAGRAIAGLVGIVSDKGEQAIDSLVDRAQAARVAGETQYLQQRGRAPGVAPGPAPSPAPAGGAGPTGSLPSLPGTGMEVGAAGPGSVPDYRDYIRFGSNTGSEAHFLKLQSHVANNFAMMARDWNQITGGGKLRVNSAYRSPEEQASINPGTNPKAAPGMSLHQHGRALDLQSAQVSELKRLGLLDKYGFKTLAGDPPHIYMRDGGIASGPDSGYPATLHGTEAVVPLPDGKTIPVEIKGLTNDSLVKDLGMYLIKASAMMPGSSDASAGSVPPLSETTAPVSINLRDIAQTGPTFAGYNEYQGYNMGPMSTDLDALKQIAGSLGAYDAATETITDPGTWKEVLKSGMLMNYDLGAVEVGTKMGGPDIGLEIGERVKEVMSREQTDLPTALAQVKDEFAAAMREVFGSMQSVQDPEIQLRILDVLSTMSRNTAVTADASQRMAQVAVN